MQLTRPILGTRQTQRSSLLPALITSHLPLPRSVKDEAQMLPSPSDSNASSPRTAPSTAPSEADIAQQLEQSIIDDVQAVNDRNWSREGPLFRHKASYWEAEVTAGLAKKKLTCDEFVAAISARTQSNPDYKLRIIDFTTAVHERTGRAEVFANMEVSGGWEGVSIPNVTLCEYHKIDGKWYHVAHRTMPGMDPNMLR